MLVLAGIALLFGCASGDSSVADAADAAPQSPDGGATSAGSVAPTKPVENEGELRRYVTAELTRFGGELFTQPPPAALDAYYPPNTRDLLYAHQMEELYRAINFARHEALRGNWERAGKSWAVFLERFSVIRKQVPEWEERFGTVELWDSTFTPVFAKGRTKADAERIEDLWNDVRLRHCDECHQRERPRVIARYHYPLFYQITLPVPDPTDDLLTEEQKQTQTISFRNYMRLMHSGILDTLNFEEVGDLPAARLALRRADAYLSNLQVACKMCHALEPRHYFVDAASLALFRDLDKMLVAGVQHNSQAFHDQWDRGRNRVCVRCHDVHMLPAKIQRSWAVVKGEQRPGE